MTYTFDKSPNSYFQGFDLRVSNDEGQTILLAEKEGRVAVDVKDHVIRANYPAEVQAACDSLDEASLVEEPIGGLYQQAIEQWWDGAELIADAHGHSGISQAGRSGGWLTFRDMDDWTAQEIIDPDEESLAARDNFLACAFAIIASIEQARKDFYVTVLEAAEAANTLKSSAILEADPVMRQIFDIMIARGEVSEQDLRGFVDSDAEHHPNRLYEEHIALGINEIEDRILNAR